MTWVGYVWFFSPMGSVEVARGRVRPAPVETKGVSLVVSVGRVLDVGCEVVELITVGIGLAGTHVSRGGSGLVFVTRGAANDGGGV